MQPRTSTSQWPQQGVLMFVLMTCMVTPVSAQLFGPPILICTNCGLPDAFDIEGDGDLDLISGTTLFRNEGNGVFGAAEAFPGGRPYDMDGDGLLDLVSCGGWHRNNGAGYDPYEETGACGDFILDLDGDGDLDQFESTPNGIPVILALNDGTGHFEVDSIPIAHGGFFRSHLPFDWDNDGDLDLIGAFGLNGNLAVALTINGTFGSFYNEVSNTPTLWGRGQALDVNADGFLDYVVGPVTFLRSSSGIYQEIVGYTINPTFGIANVDCDASLEFISVPYVQSGEGVLSIANLTAEGFVAHDVPYANTYSSLVSFPDLDGDGKGDVLYVQDENFQDADSLVLRFNLAAPPAVSLELPDEILTEDTVLVLYGGVPSGGFYTGPGVYDNVFYGALAGTGPVQISYHYMDSLSTCSSIAMDVLQRGLLSGIAHRPTDGWTVFPNPCGERLLIASPTDGTAQVTITDAMGRIRGTNGRISLVGGSPDAIWTGDLEEGMFILQLEMANGEIVRLPFLHRRSDQ